MRIMRKNLKPAFKMIEETAKKSTVVTGAVCNKCHNFVFSRSRHDFRSCPCGSVSVDGGFDYLKVSGDDYETKSMRVPATREQLVVDYNAGTDLYGIICIGQNEVGNAAMFRTFNANTGLSIDTFENITVFDGSFSQDDMQDLVAKYGVQKACAIIGEEFIKSICPEYLYLAKGKNNVKA